MGALAPEAAIYVKVPGRTALRNLGPVDSCALRRFASSSRYSSADKCYSRLGATEHDYPAGDVDAMLAEIESGGGSGTLS
jgi:hypothetical protein